MGRKNGSTLEAPTRRLLTRAQAAKVLGVSQSTLSRWAADRVGPAFVKLSATEKAGVRYPEDLLNKFVESRLVLPK